MNGPDAGGEDGDRLRGRHVCSGALVWSSLTWKSREEESERDDIIDSKGICSVCIQSITN